MSLLRGLEVEARVVYALILRETRTRFGKHYLGYLWALIEPLLWIATFAGLFYMMERGAPSGMTMVGFVATGILPYDLFRTTTGKALVAIESNKALMVYPQVRPLDVVLSRMLLEFATVLLVFAIIMIGDGIFSARFAVDSPLLTLLGFCLAVAFGGSLGLLFAGLSVYSNVAERVLSPVLRPLFWVSGIYFVANDLPSNVRTVALYNPILHIVELTRDGWYSSYTAHYANAWYPLLWIIVLSFFALTLERVARRRVQMS